MDLENQQDQQISTNQPKTIIAIRDLLNKYKFQNNKDTQTKRNHYNYKNKSYQTFNLKSEQINFVQQYSAIYFCRLKQIGQQFKLDFEQQGKSVVENILSIPNKQQCILIGTIYKEMKLKPSYLAKLNSQSQQSQDSKNQEFTSDSDSLFIEDNSGRIKMDLKNALWVTPFGEQREISVQHVITGLIAAFEGIQKEDNIFQVFKIIFPNLPYQDNENSLNQLGSPKLLSENNNYYQLKMYITPGTSQQQNSKFIALVSGLNISSNQIDEKLLSLQNFLFGNNLNDCLKTLSSRIGRLVIAGNTISENDQLEQALMGSFKQQDKLRDIQLELKKQLIYADSFLEQLVQSIPLDIMPGSNDPASHLLPQQPLHQCFFPKCYKYQHFNSVSNPYSFEIDNVSFLGTSGQNIKDIKKYCKFSNKDIDILEANIYWNHIAPTAPDTLHCYPFSDQDHFTLNELPHIYFVGNCEHFQTKLKYLESQKKIVRLICLPAFSKTGSITIVNLNNLDTFEIKCQNQLVK